MIEREYTCTVGGREYTATLKIRYCRGRPGRWYMPNGDPGYPDEPDEISIEDVVCSEADDAILERIAEIAYEDADLLASCGEMYAEEQAAMYEALAESRADR